VRAPQLRLCEVGPIGWSFEPPATCRSRFSPPCRSRPAPPAPRYERTHPIANHETEAKRGSDVNEKLYLHAPPLPGNSPGMVTAVAAARL
jgi:hypothetical protein